MCRLPPCWVNRALVFPSTPLWAATSLCQRLLTSIRNDLGIMTPPEDLDNAALRTIAHLQRRPPGFRIKRLEIRDGRLEAEISIENLAGHKLPTAYPSRRVWLHVTVRDGHGQVLV